MNGSTAKQTRRDIRRAMGPQALDLVGSQAHAIADTSRRLAHTVALVADVDGRQQNTERWVQQLLAIRTRGFWGRLTWLLCGR